MGKMKLRKGFVAVVITMALVMALLLAVGGTVSSQSEGNVSVSEEAYVQLEGEYVQQLRSMLNNRGYENCGINLTRVVDAEGERTYSIVLHHKYLDKLTGEQAQSLIAELGSMAFQLSNCSFVFHID